MKTIGILVALIFLNGCTQYVERHKALTVAEQTCVSEHVDKSKLTGELKSLTLSGHDQDWDDAIRAATDAAVIQCTPPRLFQINVMSGAYTGEWKNFDSVK